MIRFFHVSSINLGEKAKLTPKVPETISKGYGEDAVTKRICVSPTVGQCLMGKSGVKTVESALDDILQECYYVYEIWTQNAIPAENVHDSWLTDEHWILEEMEFTLVGKIKRGTKECELSFDCTNRI